MTTAFHTKIPAPGDPGWAPVPVNASTLNAPMGELDAALGTLNTQVGVSVDIDGTLKAGAVDVPSVIGENVLPSPNLAFDPHSLYYAPALTAQDGAVRWYQPTVLTVIDPDASNPLGGKTIRSTGTDYGGRRLWLSDMRLQRGEVVSLAILARVATGKTARVAVAARSAGGVTRDSVQGTSVTGDDAVHLMVIDGFTIPTAGGDAAYCDLYANHVSGTGNVDVYGWYLIRGGKFFATMVGDGVSDGQRAQAAIRTAAGTVADLSTRLAVTQNTDGTFKHNLVDEARLAYLGQPNRHFRDGKDQVTAADWSFARAGTKAHPQTGVTLSANVPARVAAFPRALAGSMTRYQNTGTRNDQVYAVKDGVFWGGRAAKLIKSTDNGLTWSEVYTFAANVAGVLITAADTLLVSLDDQVIARSTDSGANWATVLTLSQDCVARWPAFTSQGANVYVGEYGSAAHADSGKIYRSTNDGATFGAAWVDLGATVRHIHFCREDPNTGDVWYGTGDNDAQCFVKRTVDAGANWTTVKSGDQEARCTDIRFDATYAYIGGDGVIDSTLKYAIFRVTLADNTWERLQTGFDHAFYTVTADPFGRLWFVGVAQDLDGYRSNYSNVYVMDHDRFVEVARFPILAGASRSGGVVQILFNDDDPTSALGWGYGMPWNGVKILNPFDSYWTGIDLQDTEHLSTTLTTPLTGGAAFVLALQMPNATAFYAAGTWYLCTLTGDGINYVDLRWTGGKPYLRKSKTGESAEQVSLTGVVSFEAGDVVIYGGVVDTLGRLTLMAITAEGVASAVSQSLTSWYPTGLTTANLGGIGTADTGASAAYVLESRIWQNGATEGEVEAYMQALAASLWPDGIY